MAQKFDYALGLTETIIPSKQDEREGEYVSALMQFFLSEQEYKSRDVDNMSKTILDCLKGKLYVDDSQVRTLLISKKVSPKVKSNFAFIGIRELKGDTDVGIVQDHLIEQAVTMYQQSTQAARN